MKLSEMMTDAGTGLPSHTKLWTCVAYGSATLVFLRWGLFGDAPPDELQWLIYLGIVGAHASASKFMSLKYGAGADAKSTNQGAM
jgi:hypothetical protein